MKAIKLMLVYVFFIALIIVGVVTDIGIITTIGILLFILTLIGFMIRTTIESIKQPKRDQDMLSTIATQFGFQKRGNLLKGFLNSREVIFQKKRVMVPEADVSAGITVLQIETWANRLDEQLSEAKAIRVIKPILHILSGHIMMDGFQFNDSTFTKRFIIRGTIHEENAKRILDSNIQNKLNTLYEKGYIRASPLFNIVVMPDSLTRAKITATFPIVIIKDLNAIKTAMDITTDIAIHIEGIGL